MKTTVLLVSLCLSVAAVGGPLTWDVSAAFAPQNDNVLTLGEFTYDAGTNTTSQWNIDGFFYPSCPGGPPCATHGGAVAPDGQSATFWELDGTEYSALILDFASPLTDAGGIIALLAGACTVCSGPGFDYGSTISGSGYIMYDTLSGNGSFDPIVSGTASAPEPALGFAIPFALAAMFGWRKLRRSRAA